MSTSITTIDYSVLWRSEFEWQQMQHENGRTNTKQDSRAGWPGATFWINCSSSPNCSTPFITLTKPRYVQSYTKKLTRWCSQIWRSAVSRSGYADQLRLRSARAGRGWGWLRVAYPRAVHSRFGRGEIFILYTNDGLKHGRATVDLRNWSGCTMIRYSVTTKKITDKRLNKYLWSYVGKLI